MFTRFACFVMLMALSACGNTSSEISQLYSNVDMGGGWGVVSLGCNDSTCLSR